MPNTKPSAIQGEYFLVQYTLVARGTFEDIQKVRRANLNMHNGHTLLCVRSFDEIDGLFDGAVPVDILHV